MCLTKICKKDVVLKKDMIVKKVVDTDEEGNLYFGTIVSTDLKDSNKKQLVQFGLNTPNVQEVIAVFRPNNTSYYISGFHCYLDKKSDKEIYKMWYLSQHHTEKIVEFTIPAGTKVTVGNEGHHGSTVIVTQLLKY